MNQTLYEIGEQYKFLLEDLYDHETGEVNEAVYNKLTALTDTAENKCINVTRVYKEFKKEYEAISEERQRMQAREKAFKNKIDNLKSYLLENMEKCQISKIECPQFVIGLQKNPCSVDIYNDDEVPMDYKKAKIENDITKIKDDLKNGVIIPGARLVQTNSVRIR
jgi:Siphovirus Gp157